MPHWSRGTVVPPAEFCQELRYRLCIPEMQESTWCPLCDDILDSRGHHSRFCCAGGDRTIRHNKVRNIIFKFCCDAGQHPELEKANLLLPPRPSDSTSERRPADVYLPCWTGGLPAALDFAVTAPQRQGIVSEAAREPLAAATAYSAHKRSFQNTASVCEDQGIRFLPMVCETSGAWAPEALDVLDLLAKTIANRSGGDAKRLLRGLLQRCAAAIRSCNARAHFKRATAA